MTVTNAQSVDDVSYLTVCSDAVFDCSVLYFINACHVVNHDV